MKNNNSNTNQPADKSHSIQIAKITLLQAIMVAIITGVFTFLTAWIARPISDSKKINKHRDAVFIPQDNIANFTGGYGSYARTFYEQQFSIFSDSAWGQKSTLRYERISTKQTEGYLKIHYHLVAKQERSTTSYVGIYANFSNPVQAFNISNYSGVQLRIRTPDVGVIEKTRIYFALGDEYPLDKRGGNNQYAFPRVQLHPDGDKWTTVNLDFSDFETPDFANGTWPLNKKNVTKFILIIEGDENVKEQDGILEVDTIKFIS